MLDLLALKKLLNDHGGALEVPVEPFSIGGTRFDFAARRYVMGIVNLSPDSQNAQSICRTPEQALERARRLLQDGAHIIDVGAEATRQENERVTPQAQIERLLPVVERYTQHGILTSVDSYYPEVLEACAEAGARLFNLFGATDWDAAFELAARHDAAVIISYLQGTTPRDHVEFFKYDDMLAVMLDYFATLLERARRLGVYKCIIDPGLGSKYRFAMDERAQLSFKLETFLSTFRLQALGYPTLNILPWAPGAFPGEGRAAEPIFSLLAFLGGTHIVRTHAVAEAASVLRLLDAYRAG